MAIPNLAVLGLSHGLKFVKCLKELAVQLLASHIEKAKQRIREGFIGGLEI